MKVSKIISSLPATLDPDTIYLIRVGEGFDIYVTDSTGDVSYSQNSTAGIPGTLDYGYITDFVATGTFDAATVTVLTQAQYDALVTYDPNTIYVVSG